MEIVNGYVCRDCSDVALAKRNIDPAHPKDGPGQIAAPGRVEGARKEAARPTGSGEDVAQPNRPSQALLPLYLGRTLDVTT